MNIDEILVKKPRFSIICTLRNNYRCFYDELLNHILCQNEGNYECIFIVDEADVDWVKVPDSRFKVVFLDKELPLAQKRNIGIDKAVGEYIIFCDSDDYLDAGLLGVFSEIINEYSPDFIVPKVTRNKDELNNTNKHSIDKENLINQKEKIINAFFSRYLIKNKPSEFILDGCWGRAFKRDVIAENGIYFLEEPCRAEDALFVNDFVVCAKSVYFAGDYIGYYWRLNQNSEMFNVNSFFFKIVPFANKLLLQLKNVPEIYSKDLYCYISKLLILQANIFCKSRFEKQINKEIFCSLLKNSAPSQTLCKKCLRKTSWKYGIKHKVQCLMYSYNLYSMLYLSFYIKEKINKIVHKVSL